MKSRRKLRLEKALIYGFLIIVSLLAHDGGASQCITEQQTIPVGDLALVAEFHNRVEEYVALHKLLEGQVPTLEVSKDRMRSERRSEPSRRSSDKHAQPPGKVIFSLPRSHSCSVN